MRDTPAMMNAEQSAARRKAVRRTVLLFAVVAAAIYAGFILNAVLSR